MTTPFEMQTVRRGDAVVVRLKGEFDLTSKHEFEYRMREFLDQRYGSLVLDLRQLTFIDSTGLGFVLELWSRCRRNGSDYFVVRAPDGVHQVFETTGLDRELPIIDSLPEGAPT
jgi:anti-sigma B factor antagonist